MKMKKILDEKIAKYEELEGDLGTDRVLCRVYGEMLEDLNQIRKAFEEKQRKCCEVKHV